MGGPNLEVFKFATYVFLPILVMAHFGNPDWYQKNVLPVSLPRDIDCVTMAHGVLVITVQGQDLSSGGKPRKSK